MAGCQSAPTLPDLEIAEFRAPAEIEQPSPECRWPDPVEIQQAGVEYVAFDSAGLLALRLCQETGRENQRVAQANADTAAAALEAVERLRRIVEFQKRLADLLLLQLHEKSRENWLAAQVNKAGFLLLALSTL